MISARTGELGFLKIFLFRAWVAVDVATEFVTPLIKVFAYPDQVISVANRIQLIAAAGTEPNEIDFKVKQLIGSAPLAPGRYGIVVDISDGGMSPMKHSFWPATGSELLVVGEAS